jgi:hypothetical protein
MPHQDRDGEHGRAEHHDQAGGVMRPDEERQPEPVQARRPHPVNGDDEVETGQDRGEAGDEDAERRRDHAGRGGSGTERRVEGPAGIETAGGHGVGRERRADDEDVPAREVELREREILRSDHERNEEVAEHGRDGGDEEEEHHHHPVHREQLVVGVRCDELAWRRRELETNHHREGAADEEEQRDSRQVEQRDALVIASEEPRSDADAFVQIVSRWKEDMAAGHNYLEAPGALPDGAPIDFRCSMSSSRPSSVTSPW